MHVRRNPQLNGHCQIVNTNNKSNQTIEPGAFKNHFIANEEEWKSWIGIFNKNIKSSNENLEESKFPEIKYLWPEIKAAIIEEIIPNLKIKVINYF